jgi:hypothetical protein
MGGAAVYLDGRRQHGSNLECACAMNENEDKKVVLTEHWVDLKLKAFRAEVRLLVVLSLLANQVFAHIQIPSGLTAGAAILVGLKVLLTR